MTTVKLTANIDPAYLRLHAAVGEKAMIETFMKPRPSVEERAAAGKALRRTVQRGIHAEYTPRSNRPDPVAILEKQNEARVQKLVPVRYSRMLASPFTFLRGSAAVMADDLSATPVTGLPVAACGDMHVSNFGVYASAERNLIFAINDFDEIHPGPWEWDLKRLAASAAVAARFLGGDRVQADAAARQCVKAYRKRMRRYAEMSYLQVWYERIDDRAVLDAISPRLRGGAERMMDKARTKGHVQALDKLTAKVDGEHRLIEDVPLIVRETHSDGGRARWSASAASAAAAGCCCCRASMPTTPCSCRSSRRSPRCLRVLRPADQAARRAGGDWPALDPGVARHLPRLGRGRRPALLRPPACRHEGQREVQRA